MQNLIDSIKANIESILADREGQIETLEADIASTEATRAQELASMGSSANAGSFEEYQKHHNKISALEAWLKISKDKREFLVGYEKCLPESTITTSVNQLITKEREIYNTTMATVIPQLQQIITQVDQLIDNLSDSFELRRQLTGSYYDKEQRYQAMSHNRIIDEYEELKFLVKSIKDTEFIDGVYSL